MFGIIKLVFVRHGVIAALCAALGLRLVFLDNAYYSGFEELYRDLRVITALIEGRGFPLVGPSASFGGFFVGPAYYYLVALFVYVFSYHPAGAVMASTIGSVFSVWVFYRLLLRWFGLKPYALAGAWMLAVSNFDIHNAVYASNPTLLPLFVLCVLHGLTSIFDRTLTGRGATGLGLAAGIAMQLHGTALVFVPLAVLGAVIRSRPPLRRTVLIIAAAFLTFAPYLVFEIQNGFSNAKRLFDVGTASYALLPRADTARAILAHFYYATLSPVTPYFGATFAYRVGAMLQAGFLLVVVRRIFQRRSGPIAHALSAHAAPVIALWAVSSVGLLFFYQKYTVPHYYLIFWPLPIILYLFAMRWLEARFRLFAPALAIFIVMQLLQYSVLVIPARGAIWPHGAMRKALAVIQNDAHGGSYAILNDGTHFLAYYTELAGVGLNRDASDAAFVYRITRDPITAVPAPPDGFRYVRTRRYDGVTVYAYARTDTTP